MKKFTALSLAASIVICAVPAAAAPVEVTYTVSGYSGNWYINFSVLNNSIVDLFAFGVEIEYPSEYYLSPRLIPESDSTMAWWKTSENVWSNVAYGGSSTIYNRTWYDPYDGPGFLSRGQSHDGFILHVTSVDAPTDQFKWFVRPSSEISLSSEYIQEYDFLFYGFPGYEGVTAAGSYAVPEPSSALLFIGGLGAVGAFLRRRKNSFNKFR